MSGPELPISVGLDVSAVPQMPTGAGRYTAALAAGLAARSDVELTLVARSGDGARWEQLAPRAAVESRAPGPRPLRLVWEQARLPGLLERLAVGVHHSPHYTMPELGGAGPARVVTVHDMTFFDHPEWHERSKVIFFRRAIRVAAAHADVVICVSQTTADRLRQRSSPAAEVRVIPHGVDHARFRPDAALVGDGRAGDALAGLGVRPPYVVFTGTVQPRKDVPTLVRAFDRLCPAHPELTLVVAGPPGWGEKDLDRALAQARYPERVIRLGYVAEAVVPELLRRAAATAYPALEEGFGLPVLEALACGSPLVTTAGTVMDELADGSALLVAPGDADALAGALDMLVRGDTGLAGRRARGLEVAARYTWEASAQGHMGAYRAALGHHRARASGPARPGSRWPGRVVGHRR